MAKARAIIAGPSAWRFRALVTSLASGRIVRLAWWYRRIHRPWFLPRGAGTWWAECGGRDCYYPSHGSHRSHLMSQARITEHYCKGTFKVLLLAWFVYHWGWTKTASFLEFCFLSLSHCFSVFWCVSKCNIWSWQWEFGEEKVLGPRPRMMIGRWLQMSHDNSATRITSVFIPHQCLPLETGWNGFICGGFKHIGKATNFRWLPGRPDCKMQKKKWWWKKHGSSSQHMCTVRRSGKGRWLAARTMEMPLGSTRRNLGWTVKAIFCWS